MAWTLAEPGTSPGGKIMPRALVSECAIGCCDCGRGLGEEPSIFIHITPGQHRLREQLRGIPVLER